MDIETSEAIHSNSRGGLCVLERAYRQTHEMSTDQEQRSLALLVLS